MGGQRQVGGVSSLQPPGGRWDFLTHSESEHKVGLTVAGSFERVALVTVFHFTPAG